MNSEYGYDWARKHLELLKKYKVNISLFCGEYIPNSGLKGIFSYDDPFLLNIYDVVNKIFTDNKAIIKKAIERNGFDEKKFSVHYQPTEFNNMKKVQNGLKDKNKLHLLWASRIVPTKLPELVAEIGKRLDPKKYQINMYGEISGGIDKKIFDDIPSIRYHGAFDGFNSLPVEENDVFLYTALDDGVPNVILEAAAAGIPIIASDDGGVGEFIQNGKTGILIKDYLSPESYVEAIEKISKNPEQLIKNAENAQKLLLNRHNWKKFVRVVKKDIS